MAGTTGFTFDVGYERARRSATRRRRRDAVAGTLFLAVLAASASAIGYLAWEQYRESLQPSVTTGGDEDDVTVSELIVELEGDPAWSGPGVPAIGVAPDRP